MHWQVPETKPRLSEMMCVAEESVSLVDYLRAEPLMDLEPEFERRSEPPRDVDPAS